jgi:hypothetical protein
MVFKDHSPSSTEAPNKTAMNVLYDVALVVAVQPEGLGNGRGEEVPNEAVVVVGINKNSMLLSGNWMLLPAI